MNLILEFDTMWIYKNTTDNSHRFLLGEQGTRMLACIGVNPSTAEPERLDRTLESVKRIAAHNRYDGWLMWNVSSQRTTDPKGLAAEPDYEMHARNLAYIMQSVSDYSISHLWLAYGNNIEQHSYLQVFLQDILTILIPFELQYKMIGLTQKGNPRHPLYVSGETKLVDSS